MRDAFPLTYLLSYLRTLLTYRTDLREARARRDEKADTRPERGGEDTLVVSSEQWAVGSE